MKKGEATVDALKRLCAGKVYFGDIYPGLVRSKNTAILNSYLAVDLKIFL